MSMNTIRQFLTSSDSEGYGSAEGRQDYRGRNGIDRDARYLAEQYCSGFQLHDRRQHDDAVEAFYAVDRNQFDDLTDEEARETAIAYVDALWAKDEIEKRHSNDGTIDPDEIVDADYTPVREPLDRRASVVGMDDAYARETAVAWQNHKSGHDYWTPFLEAQTIELRAALGEEAYPDKPRGGQSGYGSLACRYLVGVELHDMHTSSAWEEAIRVMTPYYRQILKAHRTP